MTEARKKWGQGERRLRGERHLRGERRLRGERHLRASWCGALLLSVAGAALLAPAVVASPGHAAAPTHAAPRPPRRKEGDVLQIFDRQRVYVVTNDDPALADAFMEGTSPKERRVLSLDEWQKTPPGVRWYVSVVFLINRELLPAGVQIPSDCQSAGDELSCRVMRAGHAGGETTYEITVSAPDSAWLKRGIGSFRRMDDWPRSMVKWNVRSVAVVPVGADAARPAADLVPRQTKAPETGTLISAHVVPPDLWSAARSAGRLDHADEIVLVDRSVGDGGFPPPAPIASGDAALWRERKPGGRIRAILSAPNAAVLGEALRRAGDPLQTATETPTTLLTVRDLRGIRRVAVATVANGAGGADLAHRIATRAASDLRALDTFEVLERAGLSQVLGEIALGQAGITESKDRARVQQLAAADALLIVEITDAGGATTYSATHDRLTPALTDPPRRPSEPSRLKYAVVVPGKADDPAVKAVVEAMLSKAVGTRTEREYREACDWYNRDTLPRWERAVADWNYNRANRAVTWRENITAHSAATVSGSLRLVDLTDGLVLWEAPFTATERDRASHAARAVTLIGDDAVPADTVLPRATAAPALVARAADAALADGIRTLRGTALLPPSGAMSGIIAGVPVAPPAVVAIAPPVVGVNGRVLDVDGDLILVGLGQTDGLKVGDTLVVTTDGGQKIRLTVTRVRPRTCDATVAKSATPPTGAKVVTGYAVQPGASK